MNPCESTSSVASVHPSQTSPQVSSRTSVRLAGADGGVKSLLGSVVTVTVLLVLLFVAEYSTALMLNAYVVERDRWRMIAERLPAGAPTQLMFWLIGLPFTLMA